MNNLQYNIYPTRLIFFLNMSVDTVSLFVYQGTVYSSMSFSLNRLRHVKCLPILTLPPSKDFQMPRSLVFKNSPVCVWTNDLLSLAMQTS